MSPEANRHNECPKCKKLKRKPASQCVTCYRAERRRAAIIFTCPQCRSRRHHAAELCSNCREVRRKALAEFASRSRILRQSTDCVHHWLIESPTGGPTARGRCINCGIEGDFLTSLPDVYSPGTSRHRATAEE